jgi:protein gp37
MKRAQRLTHIGTTAAKYRGLTMATKAGAVWTGKLIFWPAELDKPLGWTTPSLAFPCLMSDIAYEDIPVEWFARTVEVMVRAHVKRGHIFQALTKRPDNLARLLDAIGVRDALPGVWWGVSAEDERRWDERVPWLFRIPNEIPLVSVEPQLGLIDRDPAGLAWVVVGGDSALPRGRAQRFDLDGARLLRDRCQVEGIPFFFKQTGSAAIESDGSVMTCTRKGEDPSEWPPDLRIRQWPERR